MTTIETRFTGAEIFNIAIQMEQAGATFYSEAAVNSQDVKVAKFLDQMSEMELKHLHRFEELKDCFHQHVAGKPSEKSELISDYLQSWLEGHVFKSGERMEAFFTEHPSLEETLWKAVGMEKDSISFYHGLREYATTEQDRKVISRIIEEELMHVVALGKLLTSIRNREKQVAIEDLLRYLDESPTCKA
ncbi:MAG TPA: ferritin family protein [Thermoanaerobaculia bacterium]|nr:ferritin family protein [Thermoanaerobaculia bacterium]HUM29111.1 ferritin family protein [Thermoanaerobaculia bacterium]HXK67488.1 ferritin family protein [Thermoanaerobaculia bacterium]